MEADRANKADQWIAVGLDGQIQAASSNPVVVDGCALALWRGENIDTGGAPVNVWEDRCPHRGMRLSHGFVRGSMLRCIYHGWGYEAGGQCMSIPAHPELTPPGTICANVCPSETRYGIVWTNLAEDPSALLPKVAGEDDWAPIRSIYVQRSAGTVEKGIKAFDHGEGDVVDTGEGIILIHYEKMSLILAVQPAEAEKTGIHVVGNGEAASTPDMRLVLSAGMERLRDALESD